MKKIKVVFDFINRNIIFILLIIIIINGAILYKLSQREQGTISMVPRYHFYFIGQNSVDPLWKQIRQGIEAAAEDYNVVVEFNAPRFNNPEEELKYLDIAITSNVDGIITHVSNGSGVVELINKAYEKGIPLVTIENDSKTSNRNAFVGTNSFILGREAAQLMIKATGGEAKIAIIVSSDYELDTSSQNLKINGFLSHIKDYPNMKVVEIYTSELGTISAEEITQSIINNQPEVDAILTTNYVDTLGASQVIVDHNKVGEISIIGYGDMENILRYIKMNIIYGTVMSDPYKMGYESLKALIDIKEKTNVSTFIDTGVRVVTQSNLHEYEEIIDTFE
ncbi:monosaccharide ABC transporter substrate-binding protein, CUT2 family [Natronincola peptidivorans]|uniref:Monosaccharide ABC transporter substrate-binding protein, CUT2 family n=1 Tax=Natronincola peptidivorans TaxID=426128 RepID=A0A1I0D6Y9_9FIRM|nr:sugar-binding protein [Natronincola peptidivorans]SET27678.1 monosaccharide ABC transporter substrate-binding protein, CUT2 family [Natronincola peptidivorans]